MKVTTEETIIQVEKKGTVYILTLTAEELRVINAALNACQGNGYYSALAGDMFWDTPTTGEQLHTNGTYKFEKTTKVE